MKSIRPVDSSKPSKWIVSSESLAASGAQTAKWKTLSRAQKTEQILLIILKLLILFLVIYAFICTLSLLSDAFRLIGGKGLGSTIRNSQFVRNPISATIIGMIITLILQSSSTLISVLVGMVAVISVHEAIPIMIGSEMGASLINVLVSMGQSGDRDQFRRAFAAATMNDIFNLLNYLAVLPLELAFGILEEMSEWIVRPLSRIHTGEFKTLQLLTEPLLRRIVLIDNAAITRVSAAIAANRSVTSLYDRATFIYRCVDLETGEELAFCPYDHLFRYSFWSDTTIGIVLMAVAIFCLLLCLLSIVTILQSLMAGRAAVVVRRLLDRDLPSPLTPLTGYLVMAVGCLIVVIVQSSSVFRSALTPLVGIGVITLERLYPLLLGANIGTTSTGVLAALSADPSQLRETLQIALCQTLYNIIGVLLFYPLPFMRKIPISAAKHLGNITADYRWFALLYTALVFVLLPSFLLLLSFLPSLVMFCFGGVVLGFVVLVGMLNWLQRDFPKVLPSALRSWDFLPLGFRSLRPLDSRLRRWRSVIPFCFPRRFFGDSPPPPPTPPPRLSSIGHIGFQTSV